MKIEDYEIEVMDEFNIRLSLIVPKGDGTATLRFIGYYATLAGVLKKILNRGLKQSINTNTLEDILNALSELETRLDLKYGSRIEKKLSVGDKL